MSKLFCCRVYISGLEFIHSIANPLASAASVGTGWLFTTSVWKVLKSFLLCKMCFADVLKGNTEATRDK